MVVGALLVAGVVIAATHSPVPVEPGVMDGRPATTVVATSIVPAAGQAVVSGTVTTFRAHGATGPPIVVPVTLQVARGQGGARIEGVQVDGSAATIVWDGGRPFELQGSSGPSSGKQGAGAIDAGPTDDVTLLPHGLSWLLDGAARPLRTGEYKTPTSVAVGTTGLAEPHDGVVFVAGATATIQTHGGVHVEQTLDSAHLVGPGSVTITGHFTVRTANGTQTATVARGDGPFVVDLRWNGTTVTVTATLTMAHQ